MSTRILIALSCCLLAAAAFSADIPDPASESASVHIVGSEVTLWEYKPAGGGKYAVGNPVISLDGHDVNLQLTDFKQVGSATRLANGCQEFVFAGNVKGEQGLSVQLIFRLATDKDPVVRFRYEIQSAIPRKLTKPTGHDRLDYFGLSFSGMPSARELRLSEFNEQFHSYMPVERRIESRHFDNRETLMGPYYWPAMGGVSYSWPTSMDQPRLIPF